MKPKFSQPKAPARGEELRLYIEGALVTPEDFAKAVDAFVKLLANVNGDTSRGSKKPQWNMSVCEGSGALVATAVPDIETRSIAREVVKRVKEGVAKIGEGRSDSADLPSDALYAVQELASVPGLTIGNGSGKVLLVTFKSADVLNDTLGVQKSAIGSIEGRLSTINERGVFQFVVFDALSGRCVNCSLPADKFREAHAAFGRRVSVFGMIWYDKDGRALSIRVENIRILKDLCDFPPISSFKGMLKIA